MLNSESEHPVGTESLGSEELGHPRSELLCSGSDKHLAAQIYEDLKQSITTRYRPHIISVHGRWGSGKTHVLNQIGSLMRAGNKTYAAQDDESPYFQVCTFDAWKYEFEGNLASPFLYSLANPNSYEFSPEIKASITEKDIKKNLFRLARTTARLTMQLGSKYSSILSTISEFVTLTETFTKGINDALQQQEELPEIDSFEKHFDDAITSITKTSKHKNTHFVVLIDDLDRCSPEKAVTFIEWLKVHLRSIHCTFILGLDHRMAARAIQANYSNFDPDPDYGFHYLHKLVDLEYEIQPNIRTKELAFKIP